MDLKQVACSMPRFLYLPWSTQMMPTEDPENKAIKHDA